MEHSHHSSVNLSSCSASTDAKSSSLSTATITMSSDGGKASNSNNNTLRSLNRASYKITKPFARNPNANPNSNPNLVSGHSEAAGEAGGGDGGGGGPSYQPQPPVYNIDKSDFRDVVQKLTGGSPAHTLSRPPAFQVPAPSPPPRPCTNASSAPPAAAPISRLHRIRPPPLAHLSPRPPTPLVPVPCVAPVDPWTRPPFSPLPPLPTVSSSVESPISAYMRRLRGGSGGGFPSISPSLSAGPMLPPPSSPLGFGCLLSPQTAYQMMTTSPALQLPTSPGVHPKLGDL